MLQTQPSLPCDPLYRRRLLEFRRFVLLFFSRGFTGFWRQLPAEALVLWRDSPNLQIYVPSAECMLALKLLAGRARDAEDIAALRAQLAIHTREQAQSLVDRYADRPWQEECLLQATLDALF